jgi:hypothetical protein
MTWFPLQAALKMSTIPGAIRATLDALLDHINPATGDPTRPDTLTMWESRELLAADTGFSEVTIKDHLKRLRGEKDLSKGQRVMVLKRVEDPRSHRAARYEVLPAALDALVDPARLEAFEARTPRGTHPYHRWRQWRASQMAPAAGEESSLPQAPDVGSVGVSSLPQADAVGGSSLSQLEQVAFPELSEDDLDIQELTTAPRSLTRTTATGPDAGEWVLQANHNPWHRPCGTYHLRGQPCPEGAATRVHDEPAWPPRLLVAARCHDRGAG